MLSSITTVSSALHDLATVPNASGETVDNHAHKELPGDPALPSAICWTWPAEHPAVTQAPLSRALSALPDQGAKFILFHSRTNVYILPSAWQFPVAEIPLIALQNINLRDGKSQTSKDTSFKQLGNQAATIIITININNNY